MRELFQSAPPLPSQTEAAHVAIVPMPAVLAGTRLEAEDLWHAAAKTVSSFKNFNSLSFRVDVVMYSVRRVTEAFGCFTASLLTAPGCIRPRRGANKSFCVTAFHSLYARRCAFLFDLVSFNHFSVSFLVSTLTSFTLTSFSAHHKFRFVSRAFPIVYFTHTGCPKVSVPIWTPCISSFARSHSHFSHCSFSFPFLGPFPTRCVTPPLDVDVEGE